MTESVKATTHIWGKMGRRWLWWLRETRVWRCDNWFLWGSLFLSQFDLIQWEKCPYINIVNMAVLNTNKRITLASARSVLHLNLNADKYIPWLNGKLGCKIILFSCCCAIAIRAIIGSMQAMGMKQWFWGCSSRGWEKYISPWMRQEILPRLDQVTKYARSNWFLMFAEVRQHVRAPLMPVASVHGLQGIPHPRLVLHGVAGDGED